MSALPALHREDIHVALREMYQAGRQHHLFAFYGTGLAEDLNTDFAGKVQICPVSSELELRMKLRDLDHQTGGAGAGIAFLVPFRCDVPMDVAGRFARNGAVRVIGKEQRLRRIFRVDKVDSDALDSPLLEYLLTPGAPQHLACRRSMLSADDMWTAWLEHEWELPAEEELALDRMLSWAASNGRGPAFEAKLLVAGAGAVLEALERYLAAKRGDAAVLIVRAWRKGYGARVLQYALLFQALIHEPLVAVWIRAKLKTDLEVDDRVQGMPVARQLADAAPTALRELTRRAAGKGEARSLLEQAEALVDDSEVRASLVHSQFLPSAWRMRLEEFGRALGAAASGPSTAAVAHAASMLERVEKHELFKADSSRPEAQRAEMALRLAAWLASDHSGLDPWTTDSTYADVERLGRWYVSEGGFVDWARRIARGGKKTAFDQGVQAIVEAADERRQALDARFTRALPKWLEAKRPSKQVVPIDDVSRRVVAKFLDEQPDRSLLVLLLDGMAWTQAVEILLSLEDHPERWGPLAWHTDKKQQLGDSVFPVVMAGLPTVTEVSRTAFFAGKSMVAGRDHGTEKDPERFRDNAAVAKFSAQGDWPRLLLRGDGHEAHGVASQEALSLVGDRSRRVVALVINAIDAALKGDAQQWHPWRAENVRSLPELLAQARDVGRTVLLASDHGHVPADLMQTSVGAMTGGARWRPLAGVTDPVGPHEVRLSGEGVWTPKGAQAVALIADEAHRYGGGAHAGEHGGATLAEVVAPCVMIRWEDPLSAQHDRALDVTALARPPWWYLEVTDARAPESAAPKPRKAPPPPQKPEKPDNQLLLPELAPAVPIPSAPEPEPKTVATTSKPSLPPSVRALGEVATIKGLERTRRERLLRAVAFLLDRKGVAKLDAFAGHLGMPVFRIRGLVANELSPVLNVDGYQVLYCDEHHVHLELEMLAQQFEVTL